ncbi:hypothetical protein BB559_000300 [Furculomyces boomerangus]|uniref:Autophagy-related protein 16 domain-containing protein n=1 Tax=Furculomyces boomerangus TaxID=61424 RepID=A0A2T9Z5P7_9FUNG|nr:hypothetical protein BB559_000300 [Furculomyces boomerangus]
MDTFNPWATWEIEILSRLRDRDAETQTICEASASYSALAKKVAEYTESALNPTTYQTMPHDTKKSNEESSAQINMRAPLAQQRMVELEAKVEELNKEKSELYKIQSVNAQRLLEISEKTRENLEIIKKQEQEKTDMETEIRFRTQKLQDQTETIKEKNKTIELVHLEDKIAKLWEENQQLVQRWLKKMNEEVEIMNSYNHQEGRKKSMAMLPQNIRGLSLTNGQIASKIPTSTIRKIDTKLSEIHNISVSPKGNILAVVGEENSVQLFNLDTGLFKAKLKGCTSSVFDIQFNSDGSLIAAAGGDNSIYIWASNNGSLVKTLTGHISRVVAIRFSPSSSRIISCSQDRTVKVWDIHTGNCLKTIFTISNCNSLGLLDNEGTMIVTGHMDHGIRTWNTTTGLKIQETKPHNDSIQYILSCSRDGTLAVIDASTLQIVWILKATGFVPHSRWASCSFSIDGRYACCGSTNGVLYFWDLHNGGALVEQLHVHKSAVTGISWNNSNGRMYSSEIKSFILVLE